MVALDNGSFNNIMTLPAAVDSGTAVEVSLSEAEMTADRVCVRFIDASGAEWCDLFIEIRTVESVAASSFDHSSDQVIVTTNNDKSGYALAVPPLTGPQTAAAVLDALAGDYGDPLTIGAFIGLLPTIAAALSGAINVTTVNPAAVNGDVTTIQGDTYSATHDRAISWHGYGIWPADLSGATVTVVIDRKMEIPCTIETASGEDQEVSCEPDSETTLGITVGKHLLQVKAVWDADPDDVVTLVYGWWTSQVRATAP